MLSARIKDIFLHIINLFYPELCIICGDALIESEKCICTDCFYQLPLTTHFQEKENELTQIFAGRIKIEDAAALCYFYKNGMLQEAMHNLKYKKRQDIGVELGKLLGIEIKNSAFFQDIDIIIPVPLHQQKLKKRGYNQSESIAEGMATILNKEIDNKTIIRKVHTESQTRKKRIERMENVQDIFEITDKEHLRNKHLLLVDDIITTGATIESLANEVSKIENTRLSVVCLAKTKY